MSYYEGTGKEQEGKIELIKTCVQAFAFVSFWICAMVYGLAWLSSVTVTADDIYARRDMDTRIKILENRTYEHTHRYYDGKIK